MKHTPTTTLQAASALDRFARSLPATPAEPLHCVTAVRSFLGVLLAAHGAKVITPQQLAIFRGAPILVALAVHAENRTGETAATVAQLQAMAGLTRPNSVQRTIRLLIDGGVITPLDRNGGRQRGATYLLCIDRMAELAREVSAALQAKEAAQ